jgi:DNA-binding transcriptional LysR family regulator
MLWLSGQGMGALPKCQQIPLVLFDHPCLFRQAALRALEAKRLRWRIALTTPSLAGMWAALRSGYGISVRTDHRLPAGICEVGKGLGLPGLSAIELRMLTASELSPAATDARDALDHVLRMRVVERQPALPGDASSGRTLDIKLGGGLTTLPGAA